MIRFVSSKLTIIAAFSFTTATDERAPTLAKALHQHCDANDLWSIDLADAPSLPLKITINHRPQWHHARAKGSAARFSDQIVT
jgi:hypothetical protein